MLGRNLTEKPWLVSTGGFSCQFRYKPGSRISDDAL